MACDRRLARYCLRRTSAVRALLARLATLPEAFEMARVTGGSHFPMHLRMLRGQGV